MTDWKYVLILCFQGKNWMGVGQDVSSTACLGHLHVLVV